MVAETKLSVAVAPSASDPKSPAFMRTMPRAPLLQEELERLEEELRNSWTGWIRLRSTMPGDQRRLHEERIRNIRMELAGLNAVQRAIDLGYDPYTPPCDWYVGLAEPDRAYDLGPGYRRLHEVGLTFNAPMPAEAMAKWRRAQGFKIFDEYLVAAPDQTLFTTNPQQSPRSLWADPVLIGYIELVPDASMSSPLRPQGQGSAPGIITEGFAGFLVAHWDLEKDLEFMSSNR